MIHYYLPIVKCITRDTIKFGDAHTYKETQQNEKGRR